MWGTEELGGVAIRTFHLVSELLSSQPTRNCWTVMSLVLWSSRASCSSVSFDLWPSTTYASHSSYLCSRAFTQGIALCSSSRPSPVHTYHSVALPYSYIASSRTSCNDVHWPSRFRGRHRYRLHKTREHWWDDDYRACVVNQVTSFSTTTTRLYSLKSPRSCTSPAMQSLRRMRHAYFEGDQGRGYFVEYIKLLDTCPSDLPGRTEGLSSGFRGFQLPPNMSWVPWGSVVSAMGSSRTIRLLCFSRASRPWSFIWTKCVRAYICSSIRHPLICNLGQVSTMLSSLHKQPVEPVRFSGEPLIFTQSDMDASNFGVDTGGNTVPLDFGEIGLFPASFAIFTMSLDVTFTAAVAKFLGWSGSSNLALMTAISHCLWQASDPRLGPSACTWHGI